MSIPYRTVKGVNGITTLTAFDVESDEPVKTTTDRNPSFDEIKRRFDAGDRSGFDLFDTAASVVSKFREITDRVSYDGKQILFDGDPEHDALANQILRALETGEQDYEALAHFRHKLGENPTEHSRRQAYDWLSSHDFKVTHEGLIVCYKGVTDNGDGSFSSTWASRHETLPSAYVNGEPMPPGQKVTQRIGDVVSMPRSEVVHNPAVSCDRGLHVGTYNYAKSFGNAVIEVHVNPRDFVSVPTGEGEKGRVCKYKVVAEVTSAHAGRSPVLSGAPAWGDVGYAPF